jgi:phosphoribosyl 1,2-cyclic phosphodiesterase
MSVRFWGVRGSIACPGPETARYGGQTSCVEVRCGNRILIFDGGTGIRLLGDALMQQPDATQVDIFLSHFHIDHVNGLPFFAPLYSKNHSVRIWAGNLKPALGVEEAMRKLMSFPLFPIEIDSFQAKVEFRDFRSGDTLNPHSEVTLRTAPLNHPGGACGYRIEFEGRSIAYLTDTECSNGSVDPAILALAKDAALVILDTTYTDAELPSHVGWGHSSWQQGIRLATQAGAKRLCLFHHDPDHDDAFIDAVAKDAEAVRPGTIVACDGMVIEL